jgi:PPOX class probable F420-dependent enzyme
VEKGWRRSPSPWSIRLAEPVRLADELADEGDGMAEALPDMARNLLDTTTFAVLATVNPGGAPQSSVIWVKREGDAIVFSTILGRRKTRNMQRDPRVSVCGYDRSDPYRYFEARGRVTMTYDGGPELIQELSHKYDGKPFQESSPDNVRVVCRMRPERVIVRDE